VSVAAAASIGGGALIGGEQAVAVAVFVALASVSVAGPLVYYLIAAERAAGPLGRLEVFMADHNAAIVTVLLLVFGAKLFSDGLAGSSG
jgi:hypothetical protein